VEVISVDAFAAGFFELIFGRRNFVQIDKLERLPEKLPMLYFRLTA